MTFHLYRRKTNQLSCIYFAQTWDEAWQCKDQLDPQNLYYWVIR